LRTIGSWRAGLASDSYLNVTGCGQEACNPPATFIREARRHLTASSLVAVSVGSPYHPTFYFDAQATIWPNAHLPNLWAWSRPLFPVFYTFFDAARLRGLSEPFFDPRQRDEERLDFVSKMGATHVLIDPATYQGLVPMLRRSPQNYAFLVDDGRWALVAVR
jgi:hypothetical protein